MDEIKPTEPIFKVPPVENQAMQKSWIARHILAEVLSLVVFLALLTAAYYYKASIVSPIFIAPIHKEKVDETADWKTYTNTQYQFEIKIPKDWVVDDTTTKGEVCFKSPARVQLQKAEYFEGLCGEVYFGTKSYLANAVPENIKTVTLGSNTFTYYLGGAGYESASYLISKDNIDYNFQTDGGSLVSQIMSSFKFTTVFCGGIAGIPCPTTGYICTSEGNYPDAGTICKKQ